MSCPQYSIPWPWTTPSLTESRKPARPREKGGLDGELGCISGKGREGRTAHEGSAAAAPVHGSCAWARAMRLRAAMLKMVFMVVERLLDELYGERKAGNCKCGVCLGAKRNVGYGWFGNCVSEA